MTAAWYEILSAAANLVGVWAAWGMLTGTMRQYRAVKADTRIPDGSRRQRLMAAWRHFRCEGGRILFHIGALTLTIWAMMLPGPVSEFARATVLDRTIMSIVFMVLSLYDMRTDGQIWQLMVGRSRGATWGR